MDLIFGDFYEVEDKAFNLKNQDSLLICEHTYNHVPEQVIQATRAYIMQVQSGITRKPAYDKSHYQQVWKILTLFS